MTKLNADRVNAIFVKVAAAPGLVDNLKRYLELMSGSKQREFKAGLDELKSQAGGVPNAAQASLLPILSKDLADESAKVRNARLFTGAGAAGLAGLGLGIRAMANRGKGGLSRNAKIGIGAGLGAGGLAALLAANRD